MKGKSPSSQENKALSSQNMFKKLKHKFMIRLFSVFCKINYNILSAEEIFLLAMEDFARKKIPFLKQLCPHCGTKCPVWSYHSSYGRFMVSYQHNSIITDHIDIPRIVCSSCGTSHALLPELLIPHRTYSLLFVLSVLRDYYIKEKRIREICEKYQISTSTLYQWKRLFEEHKKLWLGVLEDMYQKCLEFLSTILNTKASGGLKAFFTNNKFSFLQGRTKTAFYDSG